MLTAATGGAPGGRGPAAQVAQPGTTWRLGRLGDTGGATALLAATADPLPPWRGFMFVCSVMLGSVGMQARLSVCVLAVNFGPLQSPCEARHGKEYNGLTVGPVWQHTVRHVDLIWRPYIGSYSSDGNLLDVKAMDGQQHLRS
jgi:hypothetical protein